MKDYDLFVIGGGSGGVRAARRAAEQGMKVAISDKNQYGGTCVNRGCVPKKIYSFAAHYYEAMSEARAFGITSSATLDWRQLQKNKNSAIKRLNDIYESNLQKAGVTIYKNEVALLDDHHVMCGNDKMKATRILIATGGHPRPLPLAIEGNNYSMVSDDIFTLPDLPSSVAIIGGGYIAVEVASILRGLGVSVTIIHRGESLLGGFDETIGQHLQQCFRASGMEVILGSSVVKINCEKEEQSSGSLSLVIEGAGGGVHKADAVLAAIGRIPETESLSLQEVGVALDKGGLVVVNDDYQTSVSSIYAIGDVVGKMALTPVAIREAERLVAHWMGKTIKPLNYDHVATAVFSHPPIGSVGLSEARAKERFGSNKIKSLVSRFLPLRYGLHRHAGMKTDPHGALLKAVVHEDGQIVGMHMIGDDASEIIQGLGIAFTHGLTESSLRDCIGVHPTTAEEWVTLPPV